MRSKAIDGVRTEPISIREEESKSLQMTVEGNDAGVTCAKSRNGRGGYAAK